TITVIATPEEGHEFDEDLGDWTLNEDGTASIEITLKDVDCDNKPGEPTDPNEPSDPSDPSNPTDPSDPNGSDDSTIITPPVQSTDNGSGEKPDEDGESLPKTATNYYNAMLIGGILIIAGLLTFIIRRKKTMNE